MPSIISISPEPGHSVSGPSVQNEGHTCQGLKEGKINEEERTYGTTEGYMYSVNHDKGSHAIQISGCEADLGNKISSWWYA